MKFEEVTISQPITVEYVIRLMPDEAEAVCVQLRELFASEQPKMGNLYDIYTKLLWRNR